MSNLVRTIGKDISSYSFILFSIGFTERAGTGFEREQQNEVS